MLNRILGVIAVAALLTWLSGCSHAPLSKTFNEANANNIAVQTVNPGAGKADGELAALDGQKSEQLLQRYRTDTGKATSGGLVTNIK
jgi:hypothetical protein